MTRRGGEQLYGVPERPATGPGWPELRRAGVLWEDGGVLAVSKPVGIAVTGERQGADLVTLAREAGERLLPVHRIDKATSGAVLLAKEPGAHAELSRQFERRSVGKLYLAVTRSRGLPARGTIELPLSAGRKGSVRVAAPRASIVADAAGARWTVDPSVVFRHVKTYPSVTTFARVWAGDEGTLLAVRPRTGRRHQVRVHLAWVGHPIAGDPLFAGAADPAARLLLHSWRLAFDATWSDGARTEVEAPAGADFWAAVPGITPEAAVEHARGLAEP